MRMRKKPNLLPRMERCGEYLITDPEEHRGRWRELLPGARELRVELGCGKGRFTAETAAGERDVLFIAIERVPDAMIIAVERAKGMRLNNVFFVDADAAELEKYFAPGEVDRIYLNFSDPWPSNRHAKRRLTHPDFLMRYRTVLGEGRSIHFKTDNAGLFEWSLFQFPKAGYTLSEVTRNLHEHGVQGVMTDYEEKFHALGVPINRCVATVGPLPENRLMAELAARLDQWEVRPVDEDTLSPVLGLLQKDPDFFALGGEPAPDADCLRRDLNNLPPRCTLAQKHYVALWRGGAPEAVLDLVEGYPRKETLFIGLFLVAPELRRQGEGRRAIEGVLRSAQAADFRRVRLACLLNNPVGHAFWQAMGFEDLRQGRLLTGGSEVWIMERPTAQEAADN